MGKVGRIILVMSLWIAILGSSLAVVFVTHKARTATHQLELLRHQAADLQVESGQLLLEKSTLSTFALVEQEAMTKLEMVVPGIEEVVVVKP